MPANERLPEEEAETFRDPEAAGTTYPAGMTDDPDDDYLYREFGIERPRKETSFEIWQKSRARQESRVKQESRVEREPEDEEISFPDELFEDPKPDFKTRVGSFLKSHSLEVGVGAVVLIGTVVILAV